MKSYEKGQRWLSMVRDFNAKAQRGDAKGDEGGELRVPRCYNGGPGTGRLNIFVQKFVCRPFCRSARDLCGSPFWGLFHG